MNNLALDLVKECVKTKDPYLELGRCGLRDKDFISGTKLDLALRKCTHLKQLVLSNTWNQWNDEKNYWDVGKSLNSFNDNYFTTHPPALEKLVNLKSLTFCGNIDRPWALSDMGFVQHFPAITHLDLSWNQITELKGLNTLTTLQTFFIDHNQITELKGLNDLPALQTFTFSSNQITKLEGLETLSALKFFNIDDNQITKLEGLETLSALQTFSISGNQITKIKGLQALTSLENFDISSNKITEIKGLENLTALQSLNIAFNKIIELKGLETLTALHILFILGNRITELKGLETLTALKSFNISHNQITNLKGLGALSNLESLDVSGNQISDISPLINSYVLRKRFPLPVMQEDSFSTSDNAINVRGNPLITPPMEIVQQGNDAILYWFAAQDQGKVINHETKVILFGNGRSGKTTLSLQLRKNQFRSLNEKDRTHGILIDTWDIPKDDLPAKLTEKIAENIQEHNMGSPIAMEIPPTFQVKLWDFGGQEYYHATHRLFMNNNIIYLLVWEAATDHQLEGNSKEQSIYPVNYWQKNIDHFSSNNITLRVQNKVRQQESSTIGASTFKIEYRDKDDPLSIRRYESDIEVLKKGILENLSNLSYFGAFSPKVYEDIKQALAKVRSPFISYEDYEKLCEENDYTTGKIMKDSAQKETLIRFLDDTGAIVCFRFRKGMKSEALQDYVFTNPVWLTQIIYKILSKDIAVFDRKNVEAIVLDESLDPTLWIEIMKQFELIFEIEENGIKYVVPQFLPSTCADDAGLRRTLRGRVMEHAFTLRYPEFLPNSNFRRLLAKYGKQNFDFLYWRKGLVFFLHDKVVFAECISDLNERKISIKTEGKDVNATRDLFNTLVEIDDADDLQVSVNEKDFVEVKRIKEKVLKKNNEIDSTEGHTLSVSDFKPLFENKNPVTINNSLSMKKQIKIFVSYSSKDRDIRELLVNGVNEHLAHRDNREYKLWTDEEIDLGANWREDIITALNQSDAAILLVSASFVASSFIQINELSEFFNRKKEDGYLVLPVLIRDYNYKTFETLSSINFFKTYFSEYGFNKPLERNKLLPFDKLAENENTTDQQLSIYFRKLADHIEIAVKSHFKDK